MSCSVSRSDIIVKSWEFRRNHKPPCSVYIRCRGVNGYGGGTYGVGKRISLKNTRAVIDAIHSGTLASAKTERDPIFGFDIVTECSGVPAETLRPRDSWADKTAYDATAKKLASLFNKNFETYAGGASVEVRAAAPAA